MRLSFLLERRYAPYSKWLGSAFAKLDSHAEIGTALGEVLAAEDYDRLGQRSEMSPELRV
jgi:hypothetical protein